MTHTGKSSRIVFNTSPLIVLAKLGLLEVSITSLFEEAQIPRGVLFELERKHDDVHTLIKTLIRERLLVVDEISVAFPRLGLGESSAILVGLNQGKIVVLDDRKARRVARDLGLKVIGTLGILRELYSLGLIKISKSEIYRRLLDLGFYIKHETLERIIGDEEQG